MQCACGSASRCTTSLARGQGAELGRRPDGEIGLIAAAGPAANSCCRVWACGSVLAAPSYQLTPTCWQPQRRIPPQRAWLASPAADCYFGPSCGRKHRSTPRLLLCHSPSVTDSWPCSSGTHPLYLAPTWQSSSGPWALLMQGPADVGKTRRRHCCGVVLATVERPECLMR